MRKSLLILLTTGIALTPAYSQWVNFKAKGIPRLPDGKPNLSAAAPKLAGGTPDLSGTWWVPGDVFEGLDHAPPKFALNLAADLKPGDVELLPDAAALFARRGSGLGKDYPATRCTPPGLPLSFTIPEPFKIIQAPGLIAILYEYPNSFRQIFTDGRALPQDPVPSYLGYSVAKWDGRPLVVETTGFNDRTWLDLMGHPHSEALHMTERYLRRDFGHMDVELTVDDPRSYRKSWTAKIGVELYPDTELFEYICEENERDISHLVGK